MRRALPAMTLLAAALLAGCVTVATHGDAATTASAPADAASAAYEAMLAGTPPPNDDLDATVWYQTSVERDLVYRQAYRSAGEHLAAALADKAWDALPKGDRDNDASKLPPAIIVDVDETVLDNAPDQVRQIRSGKGFDNDAWRAWVFEAQAKPLPGALEFLRAAAAQGVTVFYVSNRDADQADATVANLRKAGFPIADASQFLGLGMTIPGCESKGSDKTCRRRLVGERYRVLMQVGDQVSDFIALPDNTLGGRRAAMAPYLGWIGERWWALPNPMYGSWESAAIGAAKGQPATAQRAAKEAALDDMRK
jgi:acid phosphatase